MSLADRGYYIRHNVDMTMQNTMHITFIARNLVLPYNEEGVVNAFQDFRDSRIIPIGAGSNSIFIKQYYDDKFVFMSTQFLDNVHIKNDIISAQSGVTMHKLAWLACEYHANDFWFMEDIPGSIGGGIIMNAGTHDGCMSDIVQDVTYYDNSVKQVKCVKNKDIFKFRNSAFATCEGLILSVNFRIQKEASYDDIVQKMTSQKQNRYLKQPRDWPSAGSVFKTPMVNGQPISVWVFMRDAGLSGYQIGGAKISEKHSGFIVNTGGATGKDLKELVDYCIEQIWLTNGVTLEPEWKFIDE